MKMLLAPAVLIAGLCAAPSRANDVVTVGIPGPVQVMVGGVLVTVGAPPPPPQRVVVVNPPPQHVVYVHDRPSVVYVHPRDEAERVVYVDDEDDDCHGHGHAYGHEKHKKHKGHGDHGDHEYER